MKIAISIFAAVLTAANAAAVGAAATAHSVRPTIAVPAAAAAPQQSSTGGGMLNLSLVEALTAIGEPEGAILFAYITERDAPFAFGNYISRKPKALKKYLDKLEDDKKAASGLTAWDHAVCANLVNLYSSQYAQNLPVPDAKRASQINQAVLTPVIELSEIVARRKK